MGGNQMVRALDQICYQRGRPVVIRPDNGPEFSGKVMLKLIFECQLNVFR
jgi:hypothetical protein